MVSLAECKSREQVLASPSLSVLASRSRAVTEAESPLLDASDSRALTEEEYQWIFTKWIAAHHRKYTYENFFYRYSVFKSNVDKVRAHNNSFTMELNEFADMTAQEIVDKHTGYKKH